MPGTKEDAIRVRAYEIWVAEGRPHGYDHDHWLRAAREVEAAMLIANLPSAGKEAAKPETIEAKKPKPATTKTAAGKAAKAITADPAGDAAPKAKATRKPAAKAKAGSDAATSPVNEVPAVEPAPAQLTTAAKPKRATKAKPAQ